MGWRRAWPEMALAVFCLLAGWHVCHHEVLTCPRCDSATYLLMGEAYDRQGLLVDTVVSKVRLYGFGVFLAGLIKAARFAHLNLNTLAYAVQAGLYLAASGWLASLARRQASRRAGLLVFAALALNVLAYPYFALTLTDGLSLALEMLLVALLGELFFSRRLLTTPPLFGAGCLLLGLGFGLAVMVRPANIQFAGFIAPMLVASLVVNPEKRGARLPLSLLALAGFGLAVWPQWRFNFEHYQMATIFPVADLGTYQWHAGRTMLKYGTLGTGDGASLAYTSPWWLLGQHGDNDLRWYIANPLLGLKTVCLHVFGGLDFDEYYPFARAVHAKGLFWLTLLSQLIVYWGIVGGIKGAWQSWRAWRAGDYPTLRRWGFAVGLSAAIFASWLAIYALAAVENRFALPLVTLALPWAFYGLWLRQTKSWAALWAGFGAWFYLAWQVVLFLEAIKTMAG